MKEKLHGIVLSLVRHNDRTSILNLYTLERGYASAAIPASGGKSSRLRSAAVMPLSQIELSVAGRAGTGVVPRGSGISLTCPYRTLYFHPVKNALAMFLAEFLGRFLRESDSDEALFRYISQSLQLLDVMEDNLGNFHLTFLSGLAAFAGIMPDVQDYSRHAVFDLRAGRYTLSLPPHNDILRGREASLPLLLSRLTFANQSRVRLSRSQRAAILNGILSYYSLHFPGMKSLRSPEILASLF